MKEYRLAVGAGVVVLGALLIALSFSGTAAPRETRANAPETPLSESIARALGAKYALPPESYAVTVTDADGAFAKGSVNYAAGGGGLWFAVQVNDEWRLAYDGNGIMSCAIATRYLFPTSLVPSCADTEHHDKLVKR